MCDDYLSRIGYPNLTALGTKEGAEKTTPGTPDTYFSEKDGQYIFAEYTTQNDDIVKKIKTDIEKCLDEKKTGVPIEKITEIVYCHTSSNLKPGDELELKDICQSQGILLTLVGIDKLAFDILCRYKILAKEYLHLTIDTEQIQTADDFIKQYDSNKLASTLKTEFLFREKERDEVNNAFSDCDVVVLKGSAGVGKTRFALEYAQKHAKDNSEQLYCIHSRNLGLYEDLCMYFEEPGNYFIFIDDANQLSELKLVIEHINQLGNQFSFKILITVRDYAIDKVKETLTTIIPFKEITIEKFTDSEIKELVKKHHGIQNDEYLEKIVAIAEGNARMAMMAGKTAVEHKTLDSISDATQLYNDYFSPILEGALGKDEKLIAVAGVVAFLGAFHLDHIDLIYAYLETVGITKDDFIDSISLLHDLEIVDVLHDKAVYFSEQVFANYILKYAFCDKKILSLSEMINIWFFQKKERTIFAVNTLLRVFQSPDVHEYVKSEVKTLWNRLREDDWQKFWVFFKAFYSVNLTEALSILKSMIDSEPTKDIAPEEIDTDTKNNMSINNEIVDILCGFADTGDIDAALDLFFLYYLKQPNEYKEFYNAAISAFCIQKDTEKHGYYTPIHFFTKMKEYSDEWNNEYIQMLFLDISKEFLKFEFSTYYGTRTGKGVTIYHIPLRETDGVIHYRSIIWEGIEKIAKLGKQRNRIIAIIEKYGQGMNEHSVSIIEKEAPNLCTIIQLVLSPDRIEDCLVVQHVKSLFDRNRIPYDNLQAFLDNAIMKAYEVLDGPDYDSEYNLEKQRSEHEQIIIQYLHSFDKPINAFARLVDVYIDSKGKGYLSSLGIEISLQELAKNQKEYISAIKMVLRKGLCVYTYSSIKLLLEHMAPESIHALICDNARDGMTRNIWLYAYYHELPENIIDDEQIKRLYAFLEDDSDREITESPFRDVFFLEKYKVYDPQILIKASQIILAKKAYSSFIVHIYFYWLFVSQHKHTDVFELYAENYRVLEDIYFFQIHYKSNPDHNGEVLLKFFSVDDNMPERLANELVIAAENHVLYEPDIRWRAVFNLDNYQGIIDRVMDESFKKAKNSRRFVKKVLKQLMTLFEGQDSLKNKQLEWVCHYITDNATDDDKMEIVFDALSDYPTEIKVKCIEAFIHSNSDFGSFEKLSILPTSYSATGSFVPVFSEWIKFLESLLPLFSGIKFLEHKKCILQKIDSIHERIIHEEISDIIRN